MLCIGNRCGRPLPLLLLPPLLPHPPLPAAFVPVPAWVFRLELVSGILGYPGERKVTPHSQSWPSLLL